MRVEQFCAWEPFAQWRVARGLPPWEDMDRIARESAVAAFMREGLEQLAADQRAPAVHPCPACGGTGLAFDLEGDRT